MPTAWTAVCPMGVSNGHAYKLIRAMNTELKKQGYLTIAGKLPVAYMEKKYYGFDVKAIKETGNNG